MTERSFPPEWIEQSTVLLAWPKATGDFGPWYPDVERTYVRITEAISHRQLVLIACQGARHRDSIRKRLMDSASVPARIRFADVEYNDIWVRDTAPLTTETPEGPLLLDFRFNGWGGKYACVQDAALAGNLWRSGSFGQTPCERVDFVLEGGSIDSDGAGTLLTTRHCLLNPNRNPAFSQTEIEGILRQRLGVRRILWLDHGKAEGDDTDAHVDTLARFCDTETIAYTACEQPSDPQHEDLQAMENELRALRTDSGSPYRLVPLPIPRPIIGDNGLRLPATYANFLIINDAVLLPVYADPNDEKARERLGACFPDRQIIPIDCRPLIRQFGSLHCMTMQFPKSVPILAT